MSPIVQAAKVLSIFTSFSVSLSPMPSAIRMGKTHSTGEVSILPLASIAWATCTWIAYALLTSNFFPLAVTTSFGFLTSLCYIAVYYRWTTERAYVRKIISTVFAAQVVVTMFVVLGVTGITGQSTDQVSTIIGFIAVTGNVILYSSPLETARKIVRTKSASSLPIALCVTSFCNCTLWVIIGIGDNDMFVLTPNAIGVVLGALNITLYILYNPNKPCHPSNNLTIEMNDARQTKEDLTIVVTQHSDLDFTEHPIVYETLQSPVTTSITLSK